MFLSLWSGNQGVKCKSNVNFYVYIYRIYSIYSSSIQPLSCSR